MAVLAGVLGVIVDHEDGWELRSQVVFEPLDLRELVPLTAEMITFFFLLCTLSNTQKSICSMSKFGISLLRNTQPHEVIDSRISPLHFKLEIVPTINDSMQ